MKLGIISDIHEDHLSLLKAMKILNKKQCDEIICLGDIVGFSVPFYKYYNSRNANECVSIVKANCKISVIGNHDLFAIRKTPSKAKTFMFPKNWYELEFDERKEISQYKIWLYEESELSAMLNKNSKQYLLQLPESVVAKYEKLNILFTHYLSPDITGSTKWFISDASDFQEHLQFIEESNCSYGFVGHAHIDGCLIVDNEKIKVRNFDSFTLKNKLQTVALPCIARGKHLNGLLIFDTNSLQLEIVSLQSKWEIIRKIKLIG